MIKQYVDVDKFDDTFIDAYTILAVSYEHRRIVKLTPFDILEDGESSNRQYIWLPIFNTNSIPIERNEESPKTLKECLIAAVKSDFHVYVLEFGFDDMILLLDDLKYKFAAAKLEKKLQNSNSDNDIVSKK